ncbi:MAG: FAD:protein FMN transferase [Verrucomicrobiota bacterium]
MTAPSLPLHRFEHRAMNTEFELLLGCEDRELAESASRAAFEELDELEGELSRFRPGSDIWRLNQAAAGEPISLGLAAWDCLGLARDVFEATAGAFDVSVGPLFALWREESGRPKKSEVAAVLARCGLDKLVFDESRLTVTPSTDGMRFDLGGVGKGYALDQVAISLRQEWGLSSALLNAGSSTVLAFGPYENQAGWPIDAGPHEIRLDGNALGCSGTEVKGAHILDPRSGQPIRADARNIWVLAPNASLADALSTACMLLSPPELDALEKRHADLQILRPGTE